ncbi:MAG: hypothetical protein FJX47_08210 [Alphaproteobacteria bacterium]|nr:hypothetical protein [Alphaproteobacteria bacterium]
MPRFEHPFLDHDSHIEGGALLDIHDSVIEDALRVPSRLVGRLHADMMARLARHVAQLPTLAQDERDEILASLSAPDGV